jgi:hypothetical protein
VSGRITVNANALVSLAVLTAIVAVRVTTVVTEGRTTTPPALTIPEFEELHVIAVPFDPELGNVTFCVTLKAESPLAYPIANAALSSATAWESEIMTDSENTLVSLALPWVIVAISETAVVAVGRVTEPSAASIEG